MTVDTRSASSSLALLWRPRRIRWGVTTQTHLDARLLMRVRISLRCEEDFANSRVTSGGNSTSMLWANY